jgi:hypothetical protein
MYFIVVLIVLKFISIVTTIQKINFVFGFAG